MNARGGSYRVAAVAAVGPPYARRMDADPLNDAAMAELVELAAGHRMESVTRTMPDGTVIVEFVDPADPVQCGGGTLVFPAGCLPVSP